MNDLRARLARGEIPTDAAVVEEKPEPPEHHPRDLSQRNTRKKVRKQRQRGNRNDHCKR